MIMWNDIILLTEVKNRHYYSMLHLGRIGASMTHSMLFCMENCSIHNSERVNVSVMR
jgi:hypothetical protein